MADHDEKSLTSKMIYRQHHTAAEGSLMCRDKGTVVFLGREVKKVQASGHELQLNDRHTNYEHNLYISLFFLTAAAWKYSSSTVRVGDEVTLSCRNVIDDQDKCYRTTWFFTGLKNAVLLFEDGKIHKEAKTKSDRLSVNEKCSLVIKKVTDEDVGSYTCRQIRSGEQYEDTVVYLSVVTMAEQKNDDTVTVFCSVSGYCDHSVKWLYEGDKSDVETTQLDCSANVTFTTSHLHQKSKYYELLKCEVTNVVIGEVQLFTFIHPQSSSEKPGDDATTTISPTTNKSPMITGNKWTSEETNNTTSENNNQTKPEGWWRIIVVPLGLASLITSVVVVNIWARAKGNKTQTEESIKYNDDDEDEGTVTYENAAEPSTSV
ncbi:uncharacterized protein LOC120546441 [Perca fluviatilis]|uniref:uncharacterized protein LOC120546441 n=1 Tax=Perca fluviatilis TaxID=8168 RepID=UPI0019653E62|nr:uncharacterized protein LOC120546441 [Perca fluviatilis]